MIPTDLALCQNFRPARTGHVWLDVAAGDDLIHSNRRLTVTAVRLYRWAEDGKAHGEEKTPKFVSSGRDWLQR